MGAHQKPSVAKPHDPDRWARRWGTVGAALLILGFAAAAKDPGAWDALRWRRWWDLTQVFLPVIAGALALLAVRWRPRARAATLLACGTVSLLVPVVRYLVPTFYRESASPWYWKLYEPLTVVAGICVAAGNHVGRSWPASRAARLLCGFGGATILGLYLESIVSGLARHGPSAFVPIDRWGVGQLSLNGIVILYAALALGGLRSKPTRTRWLVSILATGLPVFHVFHVWAGALGYTDLLGGDALRSLLSLGRPWTEVASWVLCTVGLAAWIEARIAARGEIAHPAA